MKRSDRTSRPLAHRCLIVALGSAAGCGSGAPDDALAERCAQALRLQQAPLAELWVETTLRHDVERTLRFEATPADGGEPLAGEIQCVFVAEDPWKFDRIAIDGQALTETEVALVNSEFLLRDLSEHPERLEQRYVPDDGGSEE